MRSVRSASVGSDLGKDWRSYWRSAFRIKAFAIHPQSASVHEVASQDAGGAVANVLAYRSEYLQNKGRLTGLAKAAADKNASVSPNIRADDRFIDCFFLPVMPSTAKCSDAWFLFHSRNEYQKTNHHNVRNRHTNGARKTANIAA
jgi:hypothetical protein